MRSQPIAPHVRAAMAAFCLGCASCSGDDQAGAQLSSRDLVLGGAGSSGQGGAQGDPPRGPTPQCVLDYTACLVRNPFDVLPCTAQAEECGLIMTAADAGVISVAGGRVPVTNSPSAFEIAACIVRDPLRAALCQTTACK